MPSKWQTWTMIPIGGLNLDENPNAVRRTEIIDALNVWFRGNTIGTRPGAAFETNSGGYTAVLPGPVQGGFEWRTDNDGTRKLMVVAEGVIYSDGTPTTVTEGAGVTVSAASSTDPKLWTFATFGYSGTSAVYAAGGSGTDTPWYWTGTGDATLLSILNSSGSAVYPTYIFAKWKRLYACAWRTAAGAISTDIAADPMTPRYTSLNQPTVWPTGNTFAGTGIGGISAYGDEYLTGFGEYTDNDGDWLLLLSNRRIYAVQEDPSNAVTPFYISRKGAIEFGCVSQHAFVSLGLDSGDAIYLSRHGIHSLRQTQEFGGSAEKMLSWKIRTFFQGLNRSRLKYAVGAYLREEGLVVFAVPNGSDTHNTVLLVLDVKELGGEELSAQNARWSIWRVTGSASTYGQVTTLFAARGSDDTPYLYGGNRAGAVFRFSDTATQDFGDTQYDAFFQTKWEDYDEPTRSKTLGNLNFQMQPDGSNARQASLTVKWDFGARSSGPYPIVLPASGGFVLGTSVLGTGVLSNSVATNSDRIYVTGHGVTSSLRVARDGSPFYVARISGQVAGAGPAREVA